MPMPSMEKHHMRPDAAASRGGSTSQVESTHSAGGPLTATPAANACPGHSTAGLVAGEFCPGLA
jgi:hypothetical protein